MLFSADLVQGNQWYLSVVGHSFVSQRCTMFLNGSWKERREKNVEVLAPQTLCKTPFSVLSQAGFRAASLGFENRDCF